MNTKILIAPQKYIQGAGVLKELGKWAKIYGDNVFVILDDFVRNIAGESITKSCESQNLNISLHKFGGESSQLEIDKHLSNVKSANIIVGIGGGKTLDTAKAVAHLSKKPVIICPTLASTDAPTSALAIIYSPDGEFERYMHLPFNPNIVLVDTELIVKAPSRFLSSGIGDALATYYEAKVVVEANNKNMGGGLSTKAAFALATLCKDTLYKYGVQAVKDCKEQKITEAFEAVVEANTLLSGLGFESSGLAAAHSIHNGLTELEETHHLMHGEKVAFGTIVQAVIDKNFDELKKIVEFCRAVGLPTTLKELHITEDVEKKIRSVARKTVHKDETIHSYPFTITEDMVYYAILEADKLASQIKEGK